MRKGYSNVRSYRNRAAHYIDPSNGSRSLCGRSPIRLTEEGVRNMDAYYRRAFAQLTVCDHCQSRRRRK